MTLWDDRDLANPHALADKRQRVRRMFSAIAPSYDLNNRLHSLWMDQRWRAAAVRLASLKATDAVVDVACGTGDLALRFARAGAASVIGVDFTPEMLPLATAKAQRYGCGNVAFIEGDAMAIPLADGSCDIVSIAFGIRNVADPLCAMRQFHRILRPGGRLVVLEFSLPRNRVLRALYNVYFRRILPRTATLISGDRTGAYRYLPESVNTFIGRERMVEMMCQAGFEDVRQQALTMGICVCYRGVKKV